MRDLAQDAAHDLAGARLGQVRHEVDVVRRRDRPDLRPHVAGEDLLEVVAGLLPVLEDDVGVDALALDVVGKPTTAASATAGWLTSADSTSAVPMR